MFKFASNQYNTIIDKTEEEKKDSTQINLFSIELLLTNNFNDDFLIPELENTKNSLQEVKEQIIFLNQILIHRCLVSDNQIKILGLQNIARKQIQNSIHQIQNLPKFLKADVFKLINGSNVYNGSYQFIRKNQCERKKISLNRNGQIKFQYIFLALTIGSQENKSLNFEGDQFDCKFNDIILDNTLQISNIHCVIRTDLFYEVDRIEFRILSQNSINIFFCLKQIKRQYHKKNKLNNYDFQQLLPNRILQIILDFIIPRRNSFYLKDISSNYRPFYTMIQANDIVLREKEKLMIGRNCLFEVIGAFHKFSDFLLKNSEYLFLTIPQTKQEIKKFKSWIIQKNYLFLDFKKMKKFLERDIKIYIFNKHKMECLLGSKVFVFKIYPQIFTSLKTTLYIIGPDNSGQLMFGKSNLAAIQIEGVRPMHCFLSYNYLSWRMKILDEHHHNYFDWREHNGYQWLDSAGRQFLRSPFQRMRVDFMRFFSQRFYNYEFDQSSESNMEADEEDENFIDVNRQDDTSESDDEIQNAHNSQDFNQSSEPQQQHQQIDRIEEKNWKILNKNDQIPLKNNDEFRIGLTSFKFSFYSIYKLRNEYRKIYQITFKMTIQINKELQISYIQKENLSSISKRIVESKPNINIPIIIRFE